MSMPNITLKRRTVISSPKLQKFKNFLERALKPPFNRLELLEDMRHTDYQKVFVNVPTVLKSTRSRTELANVLTARNKLHELNEVDRHIFQTELIKFGEEKFGPKKHQFYREAKDYKLHKLRVLNAKSHYAKLNPG